MSTPTDHDSGLDRLLFVALQVSIECTSSRLRFCRTTSLRITPLRSIAVRLVTSLSLRYQETVGAGLPAAEKRIPFNSRVVNCSALTTAQRAIRTRREFNAASSSSSSSSDAKINYRDPNPAEDQSDEDASLTIRRIESALRCDRAIAIAGNLAYFCDER